MTGSGKLITFWKEVVVFNLLGVYSFIILVSLSVVIIFSRSWYFALLKPIDRSTKILIFGGF